MNCLGRLAAVWAVMALGASPASGDLFSQYTFNDGTATDELGGWTGTIIDPLGIAGQAGGTLDLRANDGVTSANADASGAYVSLPSGIATSALQSGQANAASFEMWITVETNRQWARLFDFGSNNEDGTAGNKDYLMLVPQGFPSQVLAFEAHTGVNFEPPDPGPSVAFTPEPLPTGGRHHIVVTFDQNDTTAGPGGTAKVYLNNTLAGTGLIDKDFIPGELFGETNDWLGRSQWGGDPLIDGLYDEFRIYDHVLSPSEISANNAAGPVAAPFPTLYVNRATGAIRIENPTAQAVDQVAGYKITSAAGGLDASGWNSVAPADGWAVQTQTATELSEQGSTPLNLSGNGSESLGSAWLPTPIEDLQFSYELPGGGTANGQVIYEGNGGVPLGRSDFDADGAVDLDDWSVFLAGNGAALAGLSDVQQYLMGDLNGDDANNHADFLLFRSDFIAANGAAAFAALGVPEPSTMALAGLASLAVACSARRRRRK